MEQEQEQACEEKQELVYKLNRKQRLKRLSLESGLEQSRFCCWSL